MTSKETGPSLLTSQVNGAMIYYEVKLSTVQIAQIYKKCFNGLGLLACLPNYTPTDDYTLNNQLPYYKTTIIETLGRGYCLQCCGTFPDNIDNWNLDCTADATTAGITNIYGYVFQFARRNTLLDTQLVSCPLKRSACQYSSSGETLSCTGRATDKTYLHGYHLQVWVETHTFEGKTWQGVYKCESTTYEEDYPLKIGDTFKEIFDLIHPPIQQPWDIIRIAVYLICAYLFMYCVLYFCRRRHCAWCTKKLVFSKEICWLCKLYGVEPPDPFILQALEDKALREQGLPPERFPGSRAFVDFCRKIYGKIPHIPNIPYIYKREEPIKPYEMKVNNSNGDDFADMTVPTTTIDNSNKRKKKERQHHIKYPIEAIYAGVGHHDQSHIQSYKDKVRKEIYKELGIAVEKKDDDDDDDNFVDDNSKPKSP